MIALAMWLPIAAFLLLIMCTIAYFWSLEDESKEFNSLPFTGGSNSATLESIEIYGSLFESDPKSNFCDVLDPEQFSGKRSPSSSTLPS